MCRKPVLERVIMAHILYDAEFPIIATDITERIANGGMQYCETLQVKWLQQYIAIHCMLCSVPPIDEIYSIDL